jgi:CheY-like chemotaxis protein
MTEKPQILVVEDDVGIQDLLKKRLTKLYDVTCAASQDAAFTALDAASFDLLLLDLKVPRDKSDMNPAPDVGIDILRRVREQKVCRQGTTSPLPVLVMTAFGKDKLLPPDFLQHPGRCDYIQKPFGDREVLMKKVEDALRDEGSPTKSVQLSFNTTDKFVLVEGFTYTRAAYELLLALHEIFLDDYRAQRPLAAYRKLHSKDLASRLKIGNEALRRRVREFRKKVTKEFRDKLKQVLKKDDIIENARDWNGYRLNPFIVKLVAWEQEKAATAKRG